MARLGEYRVYSVWAAIDIQDYQRYQEMDHRRYAFGLLCECYFAQWSDLADGQTVGAKVTRPLPACV